MQTGVTLPQASRQRSTFRTLRPICLAAPLLLCQACSSGNSVTNPSQPAVLFSLRPEFVGLGVTSSFTPPPVQNQDYKEGTVVTYKFTATDGTSDVLVTLDSGTVPATGTVTMNRAHVFRAAINTNPGSHAPDFVGQTADGRTVHLTDYRGKVVVADFSEQTCPGSNTAAPILQSIYNSYRSRGVEVITILVNCPGLHNCPLNAPSPAADLRTWQQRYGLSFQLVSDVSNATAIYNFSSVTLVTDFPAGYIIDGSGVIRSRVGSFEDTPVRASLDALLK